MKKWTKLLLMALLCACLLCLHAYAESGTCGDNLTWTLDDEGLLTISGTGDMTERPWETEAVKRVVIEEGVTGIASYAFNGCANLEAVTLPSSLTSMYYSSFKDCIGLHDLYISDIESWLNIEYMDPSEAWRGGTPTRYLENWYLNGEPLREVTVPEGTTTVGIRAFENCKSLETVVLPESVTVISDYAFYKCDNLKSINFPKGLTRIGGSSFYCCASLPSIELPDALEHVGGSAFLGCTSMDSATLPDNITYLSEFSFDTEYTTCYVSSFDAVTAHTLSTRYADYHYNKYVFSLKAHPGLNFRHENDDLVVYGSDTTAATVDIPTGVTCIGTSAFYGYTNLKSIDIPEGVTTIRGDAFVNCVSLESVTLPSSLTTIGSQAFYGRTKLRSIELPEGLTTIGSSAFLGCSGIEALALPDGLTYIGTDAFKNCPAVLTVSSLDVDAASAVFDSGYAFSAAESPDVILQSARVLEGYYYYNKIAVVGARQSLTSMVVPEGVQYIENGAFQDCSRDCDVTLPDSVTGFGDKIFQTYPNINYWTSTHTTKAAIAISNAGKSFRVPDYPNVWLCCLKGNVENVAVVKGNNVAGTITIPACASSIGDKAFYVCGKIEAVVTEGRINSVGDSAFLSCGRLKRIEHIGACASIGDSAFRYCSALTELTLNGAQDIGASAFEGCTALTRLDMSGDYSLRTIGSRAFANCAKLEYLSMTTGVSKVGANAFTGCDSLKTIHCTLSSMTLASLQRIGWNRFTPATNPDLICSVEEGEGATRIVTIEGYIGEGDTVTIPSSFEQGYPLQGIAENAFAGTEGLKKLVIKEGLTAISGGAFADCANLEEVSLPEGLTEIGDRAFAGCDSLTELTFPGTLTTVGDAAFDANSLVRINMPSALETVSGDASWLANVRRIDLDGCAGISDVVVKNAAQAVYVATYGTDIAAQAKAKRLNLKYLPFALTGITIDDTVSMNLGDRRALIVEYTPSLTPDDFLEPEVLFESSDEGVVLVDENGQLRAVGVGTATVYAKDRLDSFVNASCKVTVNDNTGRRLSSFISSTYTKGSGSSGTMGMTYGARFGVGPYTFKLTKRKDATVQSTQTFTVEPDEDGYVQLSASMAVPDDSSQSVTSYTLGFTVTDAEGSSDWGTLIGMWTIDKYVNNQPLYVFKIIDVADTGSSQLSSLRLDKDTAAVAVGETRRLTAVTAPSSVTPKLVWLSSDYNAVDVGEDGTIRGVATGSATVTACATDGTGFRASCEVRCLEKPVTGIVLEPGELDEATQRQPMIATVSPEDASDPSLVWSSSNPDVATVDENGVVTWLYRGSVVITVKAGDGSGAASEYGLSWDGIPAQAIELALDPDCSQKLAWTFTPANTTVREVSFQVNNPSALEVTDQGYLHFLQEGSCEVRVVATDGSGVKSNVLTVSGSPEHPHVFTDTPAARPAKDGVNGLIGPRTCAVCGETVAETVIPADRSLTLPAALTELDDEAFAGMAAAQVWIPDGVTHIGKSAFQGCEGLLLARVPSSVTEIDDSAFDGCPNVILVGASGSAAESFAESHKLTFVTE